MEDEDRLNLRWDEHILTFVHLLNHFRTKELYCDASLVCAGGVVYPVHKVVLSACSDFFASIFASTTCKKPFVVLQDVTKEHLQTLLTYMYRGEVLVARCDLEAFLKVAENLQIKGLAPPTVIPLSERTPTPKEHIPKDTTQYPKDPPPYPREMNSPARGTSWEGEGYHRTSAPAPSARITPGERDSQRPPRKRYSPQFSSGDQYGGTFQNLVASDETQIKEEPVEESQDFDADTLTIYEREEEETMEENEKTRRNTEEEKEKEEQRTQEAMDEGTEERDEKEGEKEMMLDIKLSPPSNSPLPPTTSMKTPDTRHTPSPSYPTHSPSLPTKSPTPAHQPCSPTQPHALSPIPAHPAHAPIQATPITTSQLRRELLKPLHYRAFANLQHIPHPVIAAREGEEWGEEEEGSSGVMMRDPPPLVKISSPSSSSSSPLSISPPLHLPHHYRHHSHHVRQMDERDDMTISTPTTSPTLLTSTPFSSSTPNKSHHLLVTTQPTYKARLPLRHNYAHPHYFPAHPTYKGMDTDADAPLNLSQDTHNTHNRHNRVNTTRSEYKRSTSDGDPFLGKILTNRKRRLRGPKSWEYLVRLLRDPSTNPSLIRWENEAKGVFRLVEPAVIAQRWGRRTGKHASECLTYENFARGLRYHYATGALEPVSERSFVYKFGPKAGMALGDEGRDYTFPSAATSTGAMEMQSAITHV